MIVSSHIEKSKEVSRFKYNELLKADSINGFIVKCDQLYNFSKANIKFRIGHVVVDDFLRLYSEFLNSEETK